MPLSHAICCRPCLPTELPLLPPPAAPLSTVQSAGTKIDLRSMSNTNSTSSTLGSTGTTISDTSSGGGSLSHLRQAGGTSDPTSAAPSAAAAVHNDGSRLPVAVISIGCHPSSGSSFRALQCEEDGASFVTGERGILIYPLTCVNQAMCGPNHVSPQLWKLSFSTAPRDALPSTPRSHLLYAVFFCSHPTLPH